MNIQSFDGDVRFDTLLGQLRSQLVRNLFLHLATISTRSVLPRNTLNQPFCLVANSSAFLMSMTIITIPFLLLDLLFRR